MPGQRKSMTGTVVSDKMDKTVVVSVQRTTRHRLYHKILRRSKRYLAHDDRLDAKPGDFVRIEETRPLSRHKRWRVTEILRRGEVAEIAPREIDSEYLAPQREVEAPPPPKPKEPEEELAPEAEAETPSEAAEAEAPVAVEAEEAPVGEADDETPSAEAEEAREAEEPKSTATEEEPAPEADAEADADADEEEDEEP